MPSTAYSVCGLSLFSNTSFYWALNLVISPESRGYKHFAEMNLGYDGDWAVASKYVIRGYGYTKPNWAWQFGEKFNLTFIYHEAAVIGLIYTETNELLFNMTYTYNTTNLNFPAAPTLRGNGMKTNYYLLTASADVYTDKPRLAPPFYKTDFACEYPEKQTATGFFRVAKSSLDKKFWFYDPNGYPFFLLGTDHINFAAGYDWVLSQSPYNEVVKSKYNNSVTEWCDAQITRLKEWGFNGVTMNYQSCLIHKGLVHTTRHESTNFAKQVDYIVPSTSWTGFPNVYSELWEDYLGMLLKDISETREDPWIIGHFFDNELQWWGEREQQGNLKGDWNLLNSTWILSKNSTAKIHAGEIIQQWIEVNESGSTYKQSFEKLFGVKNINSIQDFLESEKSGEVWSEDGKSIGRKFLRDTAERYFRTVKSTFQKYDKNHIYLCARFPGVYPDILDIINKYCDINTFNNYPFVSPISGVPQNVVKYLRSIAASTPDIPMMITEWSFPSLDAGLPCTSGAGTRVDNQNEKANSIQFFQAQLMNLEFVVGSDYFMFIDQSIHGSAETFQENSNYGLVNGSDVPYDTVTQKIRQINREVCRRRVGNYSFNDYNANKKLLFAENETKNFMLNKEILRGIWLNVTDNKNIHLFYQNVDLGRFEVNIRYSYQLKNDTQNTISKGFWTPTFVKLNRVFESTDTVELYYQCTTWENKTCEFCFVIPKGEIIKKSMHKNMKRAEKKTPWIAVRLSKYSDGYSLSNEIQNYKVIGTNVILSQTEFGSESVYGATSGNINYWKSEQSLVLTKYNTGVGAWAFPDSIRVYRQYTKTLSMGQTFEKEENMNVDGVFEANKENLKRAGLYVFFPFETNCGKGEFGCFNQSLDYVMNEIAIQYTLPIPPELPSISGTATYAIFVAFIMLLTI
ncbi:hypothetical protein EIN_344030 [Entamoeba invadens IP1]|uniref:Agarase n=1 Tax=Entamoeba invadens IP1 TaxID=370355 RepID=A0A0A1U924_ENTIV|nr:hypothetical protein EIN_344030 [Entamoeba invadens IP1]ELP88483.1 hypothetical protein EIN_344030 [Entamoeba invadens IP1]|eukprot:XP_004255254.1 hypothetical protein EIN_344030 [Entamoeba invadens IP1]